MTLVKGGERAGGSKRKLAQLVLFLDVCVKRDERRSGRRAVMANLKVNILLVFICS